MFRFDLINRLFPQELFKSRRMKEEEPKRDEPETEERSAAKKVGPCRILHVHHLNPGKDFVPGYWLERITDISSVISIDRHNRRWINGSIPMVSIDTFNLIFMDVIDPSIKDFYIFLIDSIDN